jgi:hypothetical protein
MKARISSLALQAAVFLLVFGAAPALRADGLVTLHVCNNGSAAVLVATAMKGHDFLRGLDKYYWAIISRVVASGECKTVYADSEGSGAYVGIGFEDSKKQWGSGKVAQVPDFGTYVKWFKTWPILTRGEGTVEVCAPWADTIYRADDDPKADCATMKLRGPDGKETIHGPFFPITSVLYFEWEDSHPCGTPPPGQATSCGYDAYLNISPGGTDRELHAKEGMGRGLDADPKVSDAQMLKWWGDMLKKVADEADKRRAQAAADAEAERKRQAYEASPEGRLQHARERQAAREQKQKEVLAADAAGNPNVKVEAQMIRREDEVNRQRWAGTRQSPAAFDPQWMGQNVAITGTVSRVDVDPDGDPHWVTIYFKESPNATFVVCSPYPDLFQERVGLDLSALVGKTLEAAGQIESPHCGKKVPKGSIRVVESKQWQVH